VGGLAQPHENSYETFSVPDRAVVQCVSPGGQGAPVFLLPGAGGVAIRHALLGEKLGGSRPIYVIRYPGIYDTETPASSVEELARILRAAVKQKGGAQPWRLMGFSFGGTVAFEIARQALAEGEQVELLALIDAAVPDYLRAHPKELKSVLDPVVAALKRTTPSAEDDLLPSRRRILKTTRASIEAQYRYRPGPYAGHIVIVRSAENRTEVEQGFDRWEPFALGGSTTLWVPGNKSTKFQDPEFVRVLSALLDNERPAKP